MRACFSLLPLRALHNLYPLQIYINSISSSYILLFPSTPSCEIIHVDGTAVAVCYSDYDPEGLLSLALQLLLGFLWKAPGLARVLVLIVSGYHGNDSKNVSDSEDRIDSSSNLWTVEKQKA